MQQSFSDLAGHGLEVDHLHLVRGDTPSPTTHLVKDGVTSVHFGPDEVGIVVQCLQYRLRKRRG